MHKEVRVCEIISSVNIVFKTHFRWPYLLRFDFLLLSREMRAVHEIGQTIPEIANRWSRLMHCRPFELPDSCMQAHEPLWPAALSFVAGRKHPQCENPPYPLAVVYLVQDPIRCAGLVRG